MQPLASDLPNALHGHELRVELAHMLDDDLTGGTHAREIWSPVPFLPCPSEFDGLQSTLALEDLFERYSAYRVLFGQFRAGVTELEAQNAGRLQTLCSTAHSLLHRHDTGSAAERAAVAPLLQRVLRHLLIAWNVPQPPPERDVRTWAVIKTRNYRLLPRSWRYV